MGPPMSELRLNPLTGRWVTIATERSTRPDEFPATRLAVEADPSRPCPFCPGHEEDTPPALETYGDDVNWRVRVVPNRYPAFSGSEPLSVANLGPLFRRADASGIHEVLVLTPDHDATFADLPDDQVALVMAAIRDRLRAHADAPQVRYSQVIVNYGREAGASLRHPHGQLLGIPFVPGEVADEEAGFRRFGAACALCSLVEAETDADHRVVHADASCLVVCPFWSGVPYQMLVVPRTHEGHLRDADDATLTAVGLAVRDALTSLRDKAGDLAYNVVVHTLPHHHDSRYHWHVHIVPRVASVVGFEQGTGVLINIVAPEAAAELLAY